MKHKLLYIFILFLLPLSIISAQDRQKIVGKIVSNSRDLEGIVVQNMNTRVAVETEKGGYFNLLAKPNDVLVFSAVHMIGITHIVKPEDIKRTLLFIPMQRSNTVLDEIFIDRTITSESLGFGKPHDYTPSQRNLFTATTSAGGILAVDALVNAITGRTKMLKSAVEIERESIEVEKLVNRFATEYFTDYLKIPEKYIVPFGYFINQDAEVHRHINSVNKNHLDFIMSEKATQFLKYIGHIQ